MRPEPAANPTRTICPVVQNLSSGGVKPDANGLPEGYSNPIGFFRSRFRGNHRFQYFPDTANLQIFDGCSWGRVSALPFHPVS